MLIREESNFISKWQASTEIDDWMFVQYFFMFVKYTSQIEFAVIVQLCFFMGSDSLISYKTTICYCIGVYLITMLQLMY